MCCVDVIVQYSGYCYRVRPKNYDYAFRVEVPYDMELRQLRLNQMRMANNDLYRYLVGVITVLGILKWDKTDCSQCL